jgi:4,5-dihydroxyphthalate decarboxylase
MSKLRLTLACWDYDRTRAVIDGRIPVDGVELNALNLVVEETFFRMLRHREFDVSEMSLSSYTMSLHSDERPFIAIPVFPSRFFRHSCIYVNAASGIREPKDLIGKRVGVPEYQMTAAVWIRGILDEHYGVPVSGPTYFSGGEEQAGRPDKLPHTLPDGVAVQPIPPGRTLSQMTASGELDALYTARTPSSFAGGAGSVRRLFPEFERVEREYFTKTALFPIMHTIVIRRDVYEQNRWLAQSLTKAFEAARREAMQELAETTALKTMLPWLPRHLADTQQLMGENFWAYGLEANREVLEVFLRYHHAQGLSKRLLRPEELFAPESLESFRI